MNNKQIQPNEVAKQFLNQLEESCRKVGIKDEQLAYIELSMLNLLRERFEK